MRNVSKVYEWIIREKNPWFFVAFHSSEGEKNPFSVFTMCREWTNLLPWQHQCSPPLYRKKETRMKWNRKGGKLRDKKQWQWCTCRTRTCWVQFPSNNKSKTWMKNSHMKFETLTIEIWNFKFSLRCERFFTFYNFRKKIKRIWRWFFCCCCSNIFSYDGKKTFEALEYD